MLQLSIAKQRRRASLLALGWLLMTVFSCTALSNTGLSVDSGLAMGMSGQAHHDMASTEHETMPCCEPLFDQLCCDEVVVTLSSTVKGVDAADQLPLAVMSAYGDECSLLQPIPPGVVAADSQQHLASYPRLHLVHCTFLD